ncbi:MAG: permease [Spirochaetaceae bacterium]|nr:MAG: permease [Spirochaetaceae bacterium]
MTMIVFGGITLAALIFSFVKSTSRTGDSLKKALAMGKSMGPQIISVLLVISLLLALLDQELIQAVLGTDNELFNSSMGALIGSVTIIPGIIAFPLSKELLINGAGYMAVAAFITTLTMVGIATSPIERSSFGLKFTLYRNSASFVLAIIIALIMGVLL